MAINRDAGLHRLGIYIVFLACISLPVQARYDRDWAHVEKLIAARKYLSAANYINRRPQLQNDPRFVRRYIHILTRKYVLTINFGVFALKDLKPGEQLAEIRGKPGAYQMISLDVGKYLKQKLKQFPNSPHIKFAIGDYLSARHLCGCGSLKYFSGKSDTDGHYYLQAYQDKVYDAWSLFRVGYHYLRTGDAGPDKAIAFFKHSIMLDSKANYAIYNLGIAYYFKGDLQRANKYATRALGGYGKADMDADTYNVHGRINTSLKNYAVAEKSFRQALMLRKGHRHAFQGLLQLYRVTGQHKRYQQAVKNYIAIDYGNVYLFNGYIEYLGRYGIKPWDVRIATDLAAVKLSANKQIGSLHYNLGRFHHMRSDRRRALQHYRIALRAMKKLKQPPKGAIPAINNLIKSMTRENADVSS